MRFSYTISHVPGKDLVMPDTLSRAPIYRKVSCEEQTLADDVKAYVDFVLKNSLLQRIVCKKFGKSFSKMWSVDRSSHIVKMDGLKYSMYGAIKLVLSVFWRTFSSTRSTTERN